MGSPKVVYIPGQARHRTAARPFRRPGELIFVSIPVEVEGNAYREVAFPRAVLGLFNSEELRGTLVLTEAGEPVADPVIVKAVCKATTVYWEHNREAVALNTRTSGPRYDALLATLESLATFAGPGGGANLWAALAAECRRHRDLAHAVVPYAQALADLLAAMDTRRQLEYREVLRVDALSRAHGYAVDCANASFFRAEPLAARARSALQSLTPQQRAELSRAVGPLTDVEAYLTFVPEFCARRRADDQRFGIVGNYHLWDQHIRDRTQMGLSTYRLPLPVTDYDAIPDLLDPQAVAPDVPVVPRAWIFDPTNPPPAEAIPELPPWSPPAEPATGTLHPAAVGAPSTGAEASSRSGPRGPAAAGRSEPAAEPEDSRHLAWMYLALSVLPLLVMAITRRWHWTSALVTLFALGMAWEYYIGKRR